MKIVACVKQVPDSTTKIKVGADARSIVTDGITWSISPYDEYAVELALEQKDADPATTVRAVTVGPARAKDALRAALAMGCDDATLITGDGVEAASAADTAAALRSAVDELAPDLVVCGKQASDDDQGLVGPALAELLGWPHVALVTKFAVVAGALEVWKEVEGGHEVWQVTGPAVLTVQKEREGAALSLAPRDHESEEEGDPRARLRRGVGTAGRDPAAGAAAAARRGQDPEGRRPGGARDAARRPAPRRGEGPVMKIWVIAERASGGGLRRVSGELAAKAADLASGGEVTVLEVTGERVSAVASAAALSARAKAGAPNLILVGATPAGRDLGARLAAALGWAYLSECTDVRPAEGAVEADRVLYAGKVRATVRAALPAVCSVRPNAFPIADGAAEPAVTGVPAAAVAAYVATLDARIPAAEAAGALPAEVIAELGRLGVLGMTIPEADGGLGAGTVAFVLVLEALAAAWPSLAVGVSVNSGIVATSIARLGTAEQKRAFFPQLSDGRGLAAFCLTEPTSGSDAASLRMTARRDGDCWKLDGTKLFVTSARYAPFFIVLARLGQPEPGRPHAGITAFLVPAGTPGLVIGRAEHKLGLEASETSAVTFEGLRIPLTAIIGTEGKGFGDVAMAGLDAGRIGIAAQSVGIARGALALACAYAKERTQFGAPIASFQAIRFSLGVVKTELEAARLLVLRAAWLKDRGRPFTREAAQAKLYASEAANRAASACLQVFGGYGYMREYGIERYFRDARATTIYEGTSEVQRMVIARSLVAA